MLPLSTRMVLSLFQIKSEKKKPLILQKTASVLILKHLISFNLFIFSNRIDLVKMKPVHYKEWK